MYNVTTTNSSSYYNSSQNIKHNMRKVSFKKKTKILCEVSKSLVSEEEVSYLSG